MNPYQELRFWLPIDVTTFSNSAGLWSVCSYACASYRLNTLFLSCFIASQGKLKEAGQFYVRATKIAEKALGPDHPHVATALNNHAAVLATQVMPRESSRRFSLNAIDLLGSSTTWWF